MKNIIISAQMGAAGNLVKNLVLLSHKIFFPGDPDRARLIENQYPDSLLENKLDWVKIETRLNHMIQNPFLMDFKVDQVVDRDSPRVFLNHSLFWQWPSDLWDTLDQFNFIFVMPFTRFGLEWQCRAAFEKVLAPQKELLYDFCFEGSDKQHLILDYINTHGYAKYEAWNVFNMREIFLRQQQTLADTISGKPVMAIALEDLLLSPGAYLGKKLNDTFDLDLDIESVSNILKTWRDLHWPLESTFDWKYKLEK